MLNDTEKAELLELYDGDEERMNSFLETLDLTNRSIKQDDLIARAKDDLAEEDSEEDSEDSGAEVEIELEDGETVKVEAEIEGYDIELDDETLDEISARAADTVSETLDEIRAAITALDEKLTAATDRTGEIDRAVSALAMRVDERLSPLERSDEERVELLRQDMPRRGSIRVGYRPRSTEGDNEEPSLSEKAQSTLSRWPERAKK